MARNKQICGLENKCRKGKTREQWGYMAGKEWQNGKKKGEQDCVEGKEEAKGWHREMQTGISQYPQPAGEEGQETFST